MGSSLDDEYSVTRVAANVAWYSPYMRWIRGWEIGRSVGGGKTWVAGWVFERVFCVCDSIKCVLLGHLDGIFLGQANGCELRSSDEVFLENFEWTTAG